jgi:hypothetical protein
MSTTTLNNLILSVTRRTTKGFTVGEIFDRVQERHLNAGTTVPAYNTVRARVSELASNGSLVVSGSRKDSLSGRESTTFVRG